LVYGGFGVAEWERNIRSKVKIGLRICGLDWVVVRCFVGDAVGYNVVLAWY
jgi:hypothetical protein